MAYRCRITTVDNPFDPFDQLEQWRVYDNVYLGRNTEALLARFAYTSDALSDEENEDEIERAIDDIIKYDYLNIYKKVKREIPDNK